MAVVLAVSKSSCHHGVSPVEDSMNRGSGRGTYLGIWRSNLPLNGGKGDSILIFCKHVSQAERDGAIPRYILVHTDCMTVETTCPAFAVLEVK